jgi:hypothetical protein
VNTELLASDTIYTRVVKMREWWLGQIEHHDERGVAVPAHVDAYIAAFDCWLAQSARPVNDATRDCWMDAQC